MSADKIEHLPNIMWSSKAAAASALERVPMKVPFVAIWIEDDVLHWSKTDLTFAEASQIAIALTRMAQDFLQDSLL